MKNKVKLAKIISVIFGIFAGYVAKEETLISAIVTITISSFALAIMIIATLCRKKACQRGGAYTVTALILMAFTAISAALSTQFLIRLAMWRLFQIPLSGDVNLRITTGLSAIIGVYIMLNAIQDILPSMERELKNAQKKSTTQG